MSKNKQILFETRYTNPEPILLTSLIKEQTEISGRALRKYFFKGLIMINGKKTHSQAKVKKGDLIRVYALGEEHQSLIAEDLPLEIVYENNELLIINKPALIAVHPSGSIKSGTLANRVAAYFEKQQFKAKVRPVNRLDYGTSGLVIFAKNATTQLKLSESIQKHQIIRIYHAVVQGIPKSSEGIIKLPISVKGKQRTVAAEGDPAETHYRVLQVFKEHSLLELNLKTGRTHQIRVHLSHIGHPIVGDRQYGVVSNLIKRPALHAYQLCFKNSPFAIPDLTVELPEDMKELIKNLT
ncbi:MAG TPA: RluA family pseudouridine synthase [Bacillota bacterium]|jgi:23S rRNA pseudouridine1911/1915/1917 synthase|nr:RluA family pseudouridine synthase [Bacillota bacterium]HOL09858.1 RluA family pseudouridine synthase [Bacillota bacterium]HPO97582.1 RluA family pseudouridine synthase [Bacillota bacterium]